MSYVKIVADKKASLIEISGMSIECFGTLGAVTVQALAKIIPGMPAPPEVAIDSFCSVLSSKLRQALGVDSGKEKPQEEKPQEEGREHVCRCQKKAEEERQLTPEDVMAIIDKMSSSEVFRLANLTLQKSLERLGE